MIDPRPDLFEDHQFWTDVLALCNKSGKEKLKIIMEALRRAECSLRLEDNELCFSFNRENLNEVMIQKAKETIKPYQFILKRIFEDIARKHTNLKPENWTEEIPF